MKSEKIGVGVITYNRSDYYKQTLNSIPRSKIDSLVIVNDGSNRYANESDGDIVLFNDSQLGVSKTKNKALMALLDSGCEHIFIVEDDMLIKNENVFNAYIDHAKHTGIHHLCFSRVEAMKDNINHFKYSHTYDSGHVIDLFHNPVGSFMYFNSAIVRKFGLFDEEYLNAFEHIDFAYKLIIQGLMPPFWYFPDIHNSDIFLDCIVNSAKHSTITGKEQYNENVSKSAKHFVKKWGIFTSSIPDIGINEAVKRLKFIQTHYKK